jgi:cytochrome P450
MRMATCDTELAGVKIPKDAMISVCLAAANRDPSRYDDPDRFDIFRAPRQNMAFGFGAHRCMGMHLARIETEVALGALLDRLEGLRLDPDAEDVHITGFVFRTPTSLPVLFTPS